MKTRKDTEEEGRGKREQRVTSELRAFIIFLDFQIKSLKESTGPVICLFSVKREPEVRREAVPSGTATPILYPPRGILKGLQNIFPLKTGIVREKLVDGTPLSNLPDYHADSDPHTPNTGLAPHNAGVLGNPVKHTCFCHKASILNKSPTCTG